MVSICTACSSGGISAAAAMPSTLGSGGAVTISTSGKARSSLSASTSRRCITDGNQGASGGEFTASTLQVAKAPVPSPA